MRWEARDTVTVAEDMAMDLIGPVARYDLVRLGRRGRLFLLRLACCLVLFLVIWFSYKAFAERVQQRAAGGAVVGGVFYYSGLARGDASLALFREAARFGLQVFALFLLLEFALVLLATPAIVAGTIVEEKQRRTLEYLLATDLTSGEIVLGKLVSRVFVLVCLVLGAFPIIMVMQWFGGIEASLLLLSLVALVATIFSVAGLSLWCSVRTRRLRDALAGTYVLLFLVLLAWFVPFYITRTYATSLDSEVRLWLDHLISAMNVINPLAALVYLVNYFFVHGQVGIEAARLCLQYCCVQVLLGGLFVLWATRQLRPSHLAQQMATVQAGRRLARRPRPKIWPESAMAWKELTGSGRFRRGLLGWGAVLVLTLCWIGPDLMQVISYLQLNDFRYPGYSQISNARMGAAPAVRGYLEAYARLKDSLPWFVIVPFVFGLFKATLRGASSIAQERDQQTWDGLLSAPFSLREILRAKFLGSIYAALGPFVFSVGIVVLGTVAGLNSTFSAVLIAIGFFAFTAFAAVLGLFFSQLAATALRAMLGTLLVLALICLLPVVGYYTLTYAYTGAGSVADLMLLALGVAEQSWILALIVVGIVTAAKFSPKRWRDPLLFLVKTFLFGIPIMIVALMLMLSVALSLNLSVSVGDLCAFLSPPWVIYSNFGHDYWSYRDASVHTATLVVLFAYMGAGALLWFVTRWRLAKTCGRVDGARRRKLPPESAPSEGMPRRVPALAAR